MQTSIMYGFIYSMVLIHEKDIQVARVYGILPVSKTGFVLSRLVIPFSISSTITFLLLLIQPLYTLALLPTVFLSILCGLMAPILTLSVSILSKNKMEGMTWFKLVNLLVSLPLAAFFVPDFAIFFGIIPSHWAFQSLHELIHGESALIPLIVGIIYALVVLALLVFRFAKVHFR